MDPHDGEQASNIERQTRFNFVTEREKFLNHLAALRSTSQEMAARVQKLRRLHQEIEFRQADLLALKVKLSGVAMKYGLQPISQKRKNFKQEAQR